MRIIEEVYRGIIPPEKYRVLVQNGETTGLTIQLEGEFNNVKLFFGAISAMRMLDEGILLEDLFDRENDEEFPDDFSNVIYLVNQGDFSTFVKKVGNELYEYLGMKHYLVITLNYVIEVITQWEPEIIVENVKRV